MGKLTNLKPMLGTLAPRLGKLADLPESKRTTGSVGQSMRNRRLDRTHRLCEMCPDNAKQLATVVDHILPLANGGRDVDGNTRNLCDRHHAEVTAEQFGHARRPASRT